jgi:transketolase
MSKNRDVEQVALDFARNMRLNALKMVFEAKASHIGSALSITDIVAALYNNVLKFDYNNPSASWRDRFILSKGHACVAVYAALAEVGFISVQDLKSYGLDHSLLMNHISHKVNGVEFSTGSLGHGLPFGVGKALAAKRSGQDWHTYVLLSDGELAEGSNWEAFLFAAHHKLDNLIAIVDYNKLQSLTSVEKTLNIEPIGDKMRAFGWSVTEVDGHNLEELVNSFEAAKEDKNNQPKIVICHTIKGKGVSFMENKVQWHYKSPSSEEYEMAKAEILNA